MKVTITIPTPLRVYTENQKTVPVEGERVNQAIEQLVQKYPRLREHLFDGEKLRSFVNIYLNNEDIRYVEGKIEAKLQENDTITIVPSIAGGS